MLTAADLLSLQAALDRVQPLLRSGYPLDKSQHAALQAAAQAAQALKHYKEHYPLALARLWRPHCLPWSGEANDPRPKGCKREMVPVPGKPGVYTCMTPGCEMHGVPEVRTSQRDLLHTLAGTGVVAMLVGGGNRAGKTEFATQLAVATAAGRQEPWVRAWMDLNGVPEDLIPEGCQRVWVSSLTFSDAKEYNRPKIEKYIPKGTELAGWGAQDQAEARLPNGGVIVSKAAAQGRKKYQGAAIALAILDEEHPYGVFEETMARTVDLNGRVVLSMTPLDGITWPHDIFLENPAPGHVQQTISGLDNPHNSSKAMVARWGHLPPVKRAARLLGKWGTVAGAVHPDFDRNVHTCEPFEIPAHWKRFGGIDFGTRAPFVHLWFALSPDDVLHVYREHYQPGWRIRQHAEAIWQAEHCPDCYPHGEEIGSERWWDWCALAEGMETGCGTCHGTGRREGYMLNRWADPEDLNARMSLNTDYGISNEPAIKDKRQTFNALFERFALKHGMPGIQIHRNCTNTIKEIQRLKWARKQEDALKGTTNRTRVRMEFETKGDDHAHDVLRYVAYGIVSAGHAESKEEQEAAK